MSRSPSGDPERSFRFYEAVLGVVAVYRDDNFIQAQTPAAATSWSSSATQQKAGKPAACCISASASPSSRHRGRGRGDLAAGGKIREKGEFVPGEPYVFFTDPDGYEVEIWFELPTPVDPPD